MKIDICAHVCPQKFIDSFEKNNERRISWQQINGHADRLGGEVLFDAQKRIKLLERYDDYAQVLVPICEITEPYMNPKDNVKLAQSYNNAVSEWLEKYPDKYLGAAATLPMNDIEGALKEIERTITQMGFKGIVLHTPVYQYEEGRSLENGINWETMKPLDSPEFMPIYEAMSKYNYPIWIHPNGITGVPYYKGEERNKYMLFHILGWPMETAMAMSRLVCSGVLAKFPSLKFITHHCGSMIIPGLASRIDEEFDRYMWVGAINWDKLGQVETFKMKKPLEYYKMFYGDTALYGGTDALNFGFKFFGPEHVLFGTDYPMDMQSGNKFIQWSIDAVNKMSISDEQRKLIFEGNARCILKLG